jgi:hypothetical protein
MAWGLVKHKANLTALIFVMQTGAVKSFFEDVKFLQIISYNSSEGQSILSPRSKETFGSPE